jgi:hypothetical protein
MIKYPNPGLRTGGREKYIKGKEFVYYPVSAASRETK